MIFKLCNNGKSVVGIREDGAMVSYSIVADEYKQWVLDGGIPLPEFTQAELDVKAQINLDNLAKEAISNAKKNGGVYTLNTVNYQVPFDVDAQNTVVAITVQNIVGLFVSTTIEFSNGVKMPISAADWMAFATWFGTERNKFFI